MSCMLVFCFFMAMHSRAKRRTYSVENASVVLHTKVPLNSVDDPAPTICKKVLINKVSNVSVLHSKMTYSRDITNMTKPVTPNAMGISFLSFMVWAFVTRS